MHNFEYAQPRTEAEALAVLNERPGETEILAGGADLVPLLGKMVLRPARVVNIAEIESLRQITPEPSGGLRVGAAARLDELLASRLVDAYPAIQRVIQNLGGVQAQCQGTLAGELLRRPQCWYFRDGHGLLANQGKMVEEGDNRYHAILGNQGPAKFVSPSRLAPALIALGARARVIGPGDEEEDEVPLEHLYRAPRHEGEREIALAPGALVTHLILPPTENRLSAAYEVRQGAGPDMPLAAAAANLRVVGGVVEQAKIVLGQVAPTPWVSAEAARALVGRPVSEHTARAAGGQAVAAARALSHNAYKIQLAQVAVQRAILLAAGFDIGGF